MDNACKAFRLRALMTLGIYAITMVVSLLIIEKLPIHQWKFAVAVLPAIPALYFVRVFLQFLGSRDELQRQIMLHALAFAFTGTAILTLTFGFLQNVGLPTPNWVWVWPLMGMLWMVGGALATRKYQ